MLNHLRDLVFGIGGYDKVKIDARFEEIILVLPNIQLTQLSDFEILEECLYKLKEQLRVKSSNLNRVIREHNSLNKKKVNFVIDALEKKKFDFLNNAFTLMKESSSEPIQQPEVHHEVEKVEHETVYVPKFEKSNEILILENKDVKIELHNGTIPYLSVLFTEEVDYSLLKNLASQVFEIQQVQGTNIIVSDKRALIIGRQVNDNLITIPRIESDLEEIYNKIKAKDNKEEEYREITEPKQTMQTKKKEEDSLDALLSGIENKKTDLTPKPIPNEDLDQPVIERGKEVEIEKKHVLNNEIEIIEKTKEEQNIEISDNPLEIYRDEHIYAVFNLESSVLGEVLVKPTSNQKITELNESELSYIAIFSKVFGTILFETLNAHGTNLIWDFNGDAFRIVPRYQDDKLKVNWEPKHTSDDFLEQLKNKLLETMRHEISTPSEEIDKKMEVVNNSNSSERARYILDSLNRIP